jgi:hypothetical protein
MYKATTPLLIVLMLQGCANYLAKSDPDNTEYFSDASTCYQSSTRKEQIKVPTAGTMTVIQIPTGNDPGAFANCMEYKGHAVEKTNPDAYLTVSRDCMQAARHATNPDNAYADCIKHGKISVETLPKDKANEQ